MPVIVTLSRTFNAPVKAKSPAVRASIFVANDANPLPPLPNLARNSVRIVDANDNPPTSPMSFNNDDVTASNLSDGI